MKRTLIIMFTVFAMLFAGSALADQTTNTGALALDGQAQGQGQTQAINGPLMIDNRINEAANLNDGRGFAIPGEVIFPGTPGYFGEATPGHRFIPLNKLLMFTTVWDVAKAKNMLKGPTGAKDVQIRDLLATDDTKAVNLVFCSITNPKELGATSIDQVSIGTVAATNRKAISADVLAKAIVAAAERNANYIMFMAEGVNREIDASGFGIGLNYTKAVMGGGNDSSGVASGGLGYSRGWSGYIDYPWLQFTFLSVAGLENLPVAVAKAPDQTGNHTEEGSTQKVEAAPAGDQFDAIEWFKKTFSNADGTVSVNHDYGMTDTDTINGKPQS